MRNLFEESPGKLAAWLSASHVERAPRPRAKSRADTTEELIRNSKHKAVSRKKRKRSAFPAYCSYLFRTPFCPPLFSANIS
ncbi:MAG: hypothetical protein DMF68_06110 [Acidobacteria bacterium]|nr:MAG: hypothetical protein DMF68_06110 [Acidobacteriota bacterium]